MEITELKLRLIQLVLETDNQEVLSKVLEMLETFQADLKSEQTPLSKDESYISEKDAQRLLADYSQKIADLDENTPISTVLSQYTDDEKLTLVLMLRAKDAEENQDSLIEAHELFAKYRQKRKSHVQTI